MSKPAPDLVAQATRAVWDVLADRGARSGRGYMRTSSHVVAGKRRILADAVAHLVPLDATPDTAHAVAAVIAGKLTTDAALSAKVAAAMRAPPQPPAGNAPGGTHLRRP